MKQNKTPLISIIVPVYKVEQYLPTCIESILTQTYRNFELILINDGSPDNCGCICDTYAQKDSRIKVIHQKNAGVIKARAAGVNYANGEFITFVDSDDTIPNDTLEFFCNCISPDVDIIIGKISKNEFFPLNNSIDRDTTLVDIETYRKMQLSKKYTYQSGLYSKIFRRTIFTNEVMNIPRKIIVGEDWLMNIRLSFNTAKNVCFLNHVVYNYIRRPSSITNIFRSDIEYENDFFKYYVNSIPQKEREKYSYYIISQRLNAYFLLTGFTYNLTLKTEELYTSLQKDIEKENYKFPIMGWCLFYIKNPLIRFFIISLRKLFNLLKINYKIINQQYYATN